MSPVGHGLSSQALGTAAQRRAEQRTAGQPELSCGSCLKPARLRGAKERKGKKGGGRGKNMKVRAEPRFPRSLALHRSRGSEPAPPAPLLSGP